MGALNLCFGTKIRNIGNPCIPTFYCKGVNILQACYRDGKDKLRIRPTKGQIFHHEKCPCNVYPLEPHFYIVKLGYAGVYLFFLFLLQNMDCGYSLEPPRRGGSNVYPQSMF